MNLELVSTHVHSDRSRSDRNGIGERQFGNRSGQTAFEFDEPRRNGKPGMQNDSRNVDVGEDDLEEKPWNKEKKSRTQVGLPFRTTVEVSCESSHEERGQDSSDDVNGIVFR